MRRMPRLKAPRRPSQTARVAKTAVASDAAFEPMEPEKNARMTGKVARNPLLQTKAGQKPDKTSKGHSKRRTRARPIDLLLATLAVFDQAPQSAISCMPVGKLNSSRGAAACTCKTSR